MAQQRHKTTINSFLSSYKENNVASEKNSNQIRTSFFMD